MSLNPKSFTEIYEDYKNEAQARNTKLTDFNDGSINDVLAGSTVTAVQEIVRILQDRFALTFFSSASGDDLEFLAVDHFGPNFARPGDKKSVAVVTFTRPNSDSGNVIIDDTVIVKTQLDSNGVSQRYKVTSPVVLVGNSISASVQSILTGPDTNVGPGKITVLESSLTDSSVTVSNALASSGGELKENDTKYKETIKNLLQTLSGATCAAIKAAAEEVPGIEVATVLEEVLNVREFEESSQTTLGNSFKIARSILYLSDANGSANQALIDLVEKAIKPIRACGVHIFTRSALAVSMNWTASITLNPGGPNFAKFQTDLSDIEQSMSNYVNSINVGEGFNRLFARQYILSLWGPSGTNDISNFITSNPSGDISVSSFHKLIPALIEVV